GLLLRDGEALRDVLLIRHERGCGRVRPGELALEVTRGVHTGNARGLARVGDIDALDPRVRERTADKRGVRCALPSEVVDVVAVTGDQARVFAPVNLGTDQLADRHLSYPQPRPSPSWPARCSSSSRRSRRPSRCSRSPYTVRGCLRPPSGSRLRSGSDSAPGGTPRP